MNRRLTPEPTELRAFESAARHGSFTRAASELKLTQSAVSRQVKDFEERLGIALFERVRQRVVLSVQGRRLLPEVRRLLRQSEEMMLRAMASSASEFSLCIAVLPTFGSRWLVPHLPDFMTRHPDASLTVLSRTSPFDLAEEGVDIAIHYGQAVWAKATCSYLCSEEVLPVASPAFLLGRASDTPARVAAGPLLHLTSRPSQWSQWLEANDASTDLAYRGHRFEQFSMLIEAAVAGLGLALLPRYLIEKELSSDQLTVVVDQPLRTDSSYFVVLPEGKLGNPLSRAFVQWLSTQVASGARRRK